MSKLEKRPTQRDKVLSYIQQFGSITSWQAYSDLGVTQLGARIWELKKQGYIFDKTRVNTTNRLGEKTHYDIYTLVKEN
jgi:hypothetical protein